MVQYPWTSRRVDFGLCDISATKIHLQVVIDSTAKGFDSGGLNMPGSQVARCESQLCQGLKGKVGTGASLKCTGKVRQKMSGTWIFFSSSFCP